MTTTARHGPLVRELVESLEWALDVASANHYECDLLSDTQCGAQQYGDGNAGEHAQLREARALLIRVALPPARDPGHHTEADGPGREVSARVPPESLYWRDSSEDRDGSRLLATLELGGCMMHLEAYLAIDDEDHVQQFPGAFGDTADKVYEAVGCDGAWHTVEINGRSYVLIATPFCQ